MYHFTPFISEFSLSWLRGYDFGPGHPNIEAELSILSNHSLVERFWHISVPNEVDEADRELFDVRYQSQSKLVRLDLKDSQIENSSLGIRGRSIGCPLHVSLMFDMESIFGVFTLSINTDEIEGIDHFEVEEISYLCKQWLLPTREVKGSEGSKKVELTLNIRLPDLKKARPLYIREVMNYYFLKLHEMLWHKEWEEYKEEWKKHFEVFSFVSLANEEDPQGCVFLSKLHEKELISSKFPTSFGPFLNVWRVMDLDPLNFVGDELCKKYERELCYLLTDALETSFGSSKPLVEAGLPPETLYLISPNHAILINQALHMVSSERVSNRLKRYHVLDVEFLRILEIITLIFALYRAYDRTLDVALRDVEKINAEDSKVVRNYMKRRQRLARSIRRFDTINLFQTAHWQPVYSSFLSSRNLQLDVLHEMLSKKLDFLDDEIQQAILLQDRIRQREQQEQELDVLRNLHTLSLTNETQSDALMIINFVVSATASFAFTQVLMPWLSRIIGLGMELSLDNVYPGRWVILNVAVFILVALGLYGLTSYLIHNRKPAIELEGDLSGYEYDESTLKSYVRSRKDLEYIHLDNDVFSGYLRIPKKKGVVLFQFGEGFIRRYIIFAQGIRDSDFGAIKNDYVDAELALFPTKKRLNQL